MGIIDLRCQLNGFLKDLGNCGYSVRPSERKKGYTEEMLKQVCQKAQKCSLPELKLSVEKDNISSVRVIQKNGGVFCYSFRFEDKEADVITIKLQEVYSGY